MLQIQYIAINITIVDQTVHVCASFQALNKPSGYITLRRHHDDQTVHVCASFQALNKPSGYITLRRHHDVKTARKNWKHIFS